jgi:hypothetical protein
LKLSWNVTELMVAAPSALADDYLMTLHLAVAALPTNGNGMTRRHGNHKLKTSAPRCSLDSFLPASLHFCYIFHGRNSAKHP